MASDNGTDTSPLLPFAMIFDVVTSPVQLTAVGVIKTVDGISSSDSDSWDSDINEHYSVEPDSVKPEEFNLENVPNYKQAKVAFTKEMEPKLPELKALCVKENANKDAASYKQYRHACAKAGIVEIGLSDLRGAEETLHNSCYLKKDNKGCMVLGLISLYGHEIVEFYVVNNFFTKNNFKLEPVAILTPYLLHLDISQEGPRKDDNSIEFSTAQEMFQKSCSEQAGDEVDKFVACGSLFDVAFVNTHSDVQNNDVRTFLANVNSRV